MAVDPPDNQRLDDAAFADRLDQLVQRFRLELLPRLEGAAANLVQRHLLNGFARREFRLRNPGGIAPGRGVGARLNQGAQPTAQHEFCHSAATIAVRPGRGNELCSFSCRAAGEPGDSGDGGHQMFTRVASGIVIGAPGAMPKARENSGRLDTGPLTRYSGGLWTSDWISSFNVSGRVFSRQLCA